MPKRFVRTFASLAFLAVAAPLCAQSGCVNSPENPTAVLVLVGTASAWIMHRRHR